jgi:predicted Zn-ribbon and HTH transcriptional regulator
MERAILQCNKCHYQTFSIKQRENNVCPRCNKGKLELLLLEKK